MTHPHNDIPGKMTGRPSRPGLPNPGPQDPPVCMIDGTSKLAVSTRVKAATFNEKSLSFCVRNPCDPVSLCKFLNSVKSYIQIVYSLKVLPGRTFSR